MSKFAPYRWRYFWKNLPYVFWYEPKYALQRLFRGWSDDQLWSLDDTLGEIILKYLRLFKKLKRMGFPSGLDTHQIYSEEGMTDEQQETAMQQWEQILDDMIYGIDYLTHSDDKDSELREKMGIKFTEKPFSDKNWSWETEGPWDEYTKKSKEDYEDAKKKAHLFIEHFNGLWD